VSALVAVVVGLLVVVAGGLGVLTALGSRRRGAGWAITGLSGLFFPVTWVAWYVRDGAATQRHV
jgi:hypothetical protein